MTQTTTPVAEIRALVEQGKRLLKGEPEPDPETDPIIRLFNRRTLGQIARLRQLYDAKLAAERACRANDQQIADAQMLVQRMQYEYQAEIEALSLRPELPDNARLDHLTLQEGRAVKLNLLLSSWKARIEGLQLRVNDASKEFESAHGSWIRVVWARFGPKGGLEFQSDWGMVERDTDERGWRQPDVATRAQLDALLAQLEA